MIFFGVYDPYNDDNYNNDNDNNNMCFICYEHISVKGYVPIQLNKQNIYINQCSCDGDVHKECLKIWISFKKSCPICRIDVIEKNNCTLLLYNYIPCGIYVYLLVKKISINMLRIFSIFFAIYLMVDLYIFYLRIKYKSDNKLIPYDGIPVNNIHNINNIYNIQVYNNGVIINDILLNDLGI
jgi:hypothetical protein